MRKFLQSKKIRHHINLFLIGFFAFHFVLPHEGLSEFVLCIGNDGHIAVERSAEDATCSDDEALSHQTAIETHDEHCCDIDAPHCGDCRDFSLTSDCQDEEALAPQKPFKIQAVQLLAVTDFLTDDRSVNDLKFNTAIAPNTFHYPAMASIRSTVLLI